MAPSIEVVLMVGAGVFLGFEITRTAIPWAFDGWRKLPLKGKHLANFTWKDELCVSINRLLSVPFVLHYMGYFLQDPSVKRLASELTFGNTIAAMLGWFLAYDLMYWLFHRLLHHRALYAMVHSHHHRQISPSRGIADAMNVHPFEYVVGEYLHLVAVHVVRVAGVPGHLFTGATFLVAMGVLTALNHTRSDVRFLNNTFSVAAHDAHHRLLTCNYAQYLTFWDRAFGTLRWL